MRRLLVVAVFECLTLFPQLVWADFRVETYKAPFSVRSLADVEELINGQAYATATSCSSTINFWDGIAEGRVLDSALFPGGFTENLGARFTATLEVPVSGDYTFVTHNDDGVRLKIDGIPVIDDDEAHGLQDRIGTINLTDGEHSLELLFFESSGAAAVELFAAVGVYTSFEDFPLVGDTAAGGLSTTPIPEMECQLQIQVPEERDELIAFYQATGGDNWDENSGWKAAPTLADGFNDDPCKEPLWFGVDCEGGIVGQFHLSENGLSGTLPPELGQLRGLTSLQLQGNRLTGEIPPSLGQLTAARLIFLHFNRLEGPIPPELGNLKAALALLLSGNELTGQIPPELGNLRELVSLWISSNKLSGAIPPELGNLSQLSQLWLPGNRLTGEIPSEIGNLANLRELRLARNQLIGAIPPELGNLTNLEIMNLASNRLFGEIPFSLGRLVKLTSLNLSFNLLSGPIPPELGQMVMLEYLGLHGNQLSGELPPELGQLQSLERLFLRRNWLTGNIPVELANLPNIEVLSLSANQLNGMVPAEFASLPEGSLDLRNNRLSVTDGFLSEALDQTQAGSASWERLQSTAAVYAHLAIGGGFKAVMNVSTSASDQWHGRIHLSGGNWPESYSWQLNGEDRTGQRDFEILLEPGSTKQYVISSTSANALNGWLSLSAEGNSLPEDVYVSYFYNYSEGDSLIDSTGVGASQLGASFYFPVERRVNEGVDTGIAIRGIGKKVQLELYGDDGAFVDRVAVTSDSARLISELFPGYDSVGYINAWSSDFPFLMTVLRVEIDSKGGVQLTSVPPTTYSERLDRR